MTFAYAPVVACDEENGVVVDTGILSCLDEACYTVVDKFLIAVIFRCVPSEGVAALIDSSIIAEEERRFFVLDVVYSLVRYLVGREYFTARLVGHATVGHVLIVAYSQRVDDIAYAIPVVECSGLRLGILFVEFGEDSGEYSVISDSR